MFRQFVLRSMLLAGIATNIAFLLINLAPERPHLRARQRVKLLLRATPQTARWVRQNELGEFGFAHDLDIEVVALPSFEDVVARLRKEVTEPSGVILAALDDEHADEVREERLVRAVEDLVPPEELEGLAKGIIPEAAARAKGPDRKLWFLPKRASIDVTAFLRPAVEDAYLHWQLDRPAIEAALREANGRGLPKGYEFEKSPAQWDDYDVFVAGWYWAHHPAPWAKTRLNGDELAGIHPRLALRTGGSDEAVLDLVNGFYRHGLRDRDLGQVDHPAVLDTLQWAALFHKHGLIAHECESAAGCDADSVSGLVRSRRIAYAPISQEDALWVHGGARKDDAWGMDAPSELGFVIRPAGASLELKPDGTVLRQRATHSFLATYLWAIPAKGQQPKLGVQLARFLTQRGLQQREAEALGMLPIRQDLREQYPIYFRLDWMQHLLDASYRQIYRGASAVPSDLVDKDWDQLYTQLHDAVARRPAAETPVTLTAVREAAKKAAANFHPELTRAN